MIEQPGLTTRTPWTTTELATLRKHAHEGAAALATRLGRTESAIRSFASYHRISLRRTGSRSGLLLGQPRGTSWSDLRTAGGLSTTMATAIATDIRDGRIDATAIEEQLRAVAAGKPLDLCAACATRAAGPTGFCRTCHLHALAEAHRTVQAEDRAQRDLWQARQDKKRKKDVQ